MISEKEKAVARMIQGDISLDRCLFKGLANLAGLTEEDILQAINDMMGKGVIRKFGAILRHQKAGYAENAMLIWAAPEDQCEVTGNILASFPEITHCYERTPPFEGKYTIFTMVHFRTGEMERVIEKLSRAAGITDFKVLTSEEEYKKSSMVYFKMAGSSEKLFEEAVKIIPGGVNSPVRAFKAVDGTPLFISEARGSRVYDVEGREYIDYVSSWGPMILGHAHREVVEAIQKAAERGTSYGAPTALEVEMARTIVDAIPSIEMVRMVSSGTEAAMSAIRLARGYTGRDRIIKFEGCYHGHADSLLVKAGSGVATFGIPGSPGVPPVLAELTMTLSYNDIDAVIHAVERYGDELACIIVEPVAGNMGVVLPKTGFLKTLREITRQRGIVLIFDEVITGFRLTYGGFQELAGIEPDLTCLGKIIGGGLPVGAFGGKREIMEHLAPSGSVYQAGTLSGNPVAMSAGLATLKILHRNKDEYACLAQKTASLCDNLKKCFDLKDIPVVINRIGSMFTVFFTTGDVYDYGSAARCDTKRFARYFRGMLARGINLAPSQFEAAFLSFAHSDEDLGKTIDACTETLRTL
jgi:glutamate-1-semialdehyde 2,1-aminomutase